MEKKYLVGIDVGTTGAKTSIFNFEGVVVGSGYREYTCSYPKPNWVEQDPLLLVDSVMAATKEALQSSSIDPAEIASIGLSAQRCSAVFIDENGVPLKMISWQDNRTSYEVEQIREKITPEDFYRITGLPLSTTWILSKIMWLKNNEPDVWAKVDKVVQVHDFILKALGADDYYVDEPDACFFGVWSTDKLSWDSDLMQKFEISPSLLPEVKPSGTQIGTTSKEVSSKTGLAEGTPLCVGAGDQNCATVGAGIIKGGNVSVSIGTGGMAIAFLDKPYRDPAGQSMVTNHAIHGRWQLEGYQAGAAGVFRWFRDEVATLEKTIADENGKDVFDMINELIEKTPVGSKGLVFLPYLASATAPRWNSSARGTLIGLTFAHDRGCLARAFMEGITMEQKDIIEAMLRTGVEVQAARIMGGATKSELWNQMQADMYNLPVETLKVTDAAVLGAAILAGVGVGVFSSVENGVEQMVSISKRYMPIAENVQTYNDLYQVYSKAYNGLADSGTFDALVAIQDRY
jgi:xylulokinase